MKNIVILPAAGIGSRMKLDTPKQFFELNGKPLVVYALEKFEIHNEIDEIVVVTMQDRIEYTRQICKKYGIEKVGENIIVGGGTNGESIYNGVQYLKNKEDNCVVLIHDGDRCMISDKIISDNISAVKKYGSAVTVVPVAEALYRGKDGESVEYVPRDGLYRIQTPYTYMLNDLLRLYLEAKDAGLDYKNIAPCLLKQLLGQSSHLVDGSILNFKITYPEDIDIMKKIINKEVGM